MNVSSWISEYYPFHWKWEADRLEIRVRISIFTIICACAGLPTLVWSVSDLIHHRKNGHRISAFIILLLLTDFVELFLCPYILIKYLLDEIRYTDWTWSVLCSLWSSSRDYGLLLNQLVALEGILSVRFPLYTAAVFSSPGFIFFYIVAFLSIVTSRIFFYIYYSWIVLFMLVVSLITWIISCGASCSADHRSQTSRKLDHHILIVFIFILLVLFLPFILLHLFSLFLPYKLPFVWHIPRLLARVRLISDPLLCVLVCRQNLSIQTSQTPERTSLV